ncbi:hypothetical protein [Piscinibacter koreensis]|uniref:Uncharacterized protein n=1 Tax=Piscinibacter koreensis TaxID=2742824 RepID=A0A7Y6TY02_9BURK|nr:hypothetical protein [Schlegelella koreensis]NUZ07610.1 hypothetical protein [Schlegelella koreensis]
MPLDLADLNARAAGARLLVFDKRGGTLKGETHLPPFELGDDGIAHSVLVEQLGCTGGWYELRGRDGDLLGEGAITWSAVADDPTH